jgi:hypothetical protein
MGGKISAYLNKKDHYEDLGRNGGILKYTLKK